MKKCFILLLAALIAVLALSACAKDKTTDAADTTASDADASENAGADPADVMALYKTPAEAVPLDLTAEEIESTDIGFTKDDEGRITECTYEIGGIGVVVTYDYTETKVHITATMNETVVAREVFDHPGTPDGEAGLMEYGGYYFTGFAAEQPDA
ncbi:MAG: hypothetical protein IJK02_02455 [Clostridia bacterium]|nr:hypothetical protein [Clostridia bacterium]